MTTDPPDLRTLATIVAKARAARWRYTETLDPTELANFVQREAGDANLLADLAAGLPTHRAMVLEEAATALEAAKPSVKRFWDTNDANRVYVTNDLAKLLRRLASATPPAHQDGPGATGDATAVPEATERRSAGCDDCDDVCTEKCACPGCTAPQADRP